MEHKIERNSLSFIRFHSNFTRETAMAGSKDLKDIKSKLKRNVFTLYNPFHPGLNKANFGHQSF